MSSSRETYTEEFKRAIVSKLLAPGGPSANALSKELGICQPTLSRWRRDYRQVSDMNERSTDSISLLEQQQYLLAYKSLAESERGEFLRKNGLKSSDIERFSETIEAALGQISSQQKRGRGRPSKDPEVKQLEKELSMVKKDLHRKEKALAETAARVVLLKKSRILFGLDPEEESELL